MGDGRDGADQLAVLVDAAQGGIAGLDGDGLPGVAEGDLDALTGNLDTAAARDLPLDDHAGRRKWLRPRQADALEAVALARRDGAGQAAPQDAVLSEDVHDLAVQAEAGALPGQRGADLDDLTAEGDDSGKVDHPLDLDAAGRRQGSRCWPGRGGLPGVRQPGGAGPGRPRSAGRARS